MNPQFFFPFFILSSLYSIAQPKVNYDENLVPTYQLPKLLTSLSGQQVASANDWEKSRRDEILDIFKEEVYGGIPLTNIQPSSVEFAEESTSALNGSASRTQVVIHYEQNRKSLKINVLLYLPKEVESPPVFVGYNFYGNHTTIDDPYITLTDSWIRNNQNFEITNNRATEASRGKRKNRWPIQKIINAGLGIALVYYGDVDPDQNDLTDGVHSLLYETGQIKPKANEWGSISAWSWGFSEVLTVLKKLDYLNDSKFIAFGHSRLGKTSLWAGALDQRFDMVISNDSGCGGAALFNRKYGETAAVINNSFPHWFNTNFKKYSGTEERLPIDQHMLIALMAPRPVYIASAEDDRWADPKGEYLAGVHATPVYNLYDLDGLEGEELPNIHAPIHNSIGYHIRAGKHDVTDYDWEQYFRFAKQHFEK